MRSSFFGPASSLRVCHTIRRKPTLYWCLAFLTLVAMPAMAGNKPQPGLPFSVKVALEKLDPLPDYMGPNNQLDMDFPYGPVKIGNEYWIIYKNGYNDPVLRYKGTNIENAVRQPDGKANLPRGAYILGGLWYDAKAGKLYAPLHFEVASYGRAVRREIHLASSTDKGLTWKYEGPLVTVDKVPRHLKPGPEYSGLMWDGGDGDHIIYVDERGGYIYLYSNYYMWPKIGSPAANFVRRRVARCAIADAMAPGKWWKFYKGAWDQPGIGGKASYVNAYVVFYDTCLNKYLSFNIPGGISACDDLSKQDWSPSFYLGPYWAADGLWAIWPTNEAKDNTSTGGKSIYVYNFWQNRPGDRYRVEFGQGETPAAGGYISPTSTTGNYWGADPSQCYGYTPMFESSDPIDARRTRRVGSSSPETSYSGDWKEVDDSTFYDGKARAASKAGSSIEFRFTGRDIYWRAVEGPAMGRADVYLDDKLQGTVDCWGSQTNPYQFGFIKRGLSNRPHTIKIVATGGKNPNSGGTEIAHMLFEYSAESYRASDCFSSVAGKNRWFNQERIGNTFRDLTFSDPIWASGDGCEVGYFQMTPGAGGDAVRKWVAPHDGTVRIEGNPALAGAGSAAVSVLKGDSSIWSANLDASGTASCDIQVPVRAGQSIEFAAANRGPAATQGPGIESPVPDTVELNGRAGKPMKLGSTETPLGLHFKKSGTVIVHLARPATSFIATAGVDANAKAAEPIDFSVISGGKVIYKFDPSWRQPNGAWVNVDLEGATEFEIKGSKELDLTDARAVPVDAVNTADSKGGWDPARVIPLGSLPLQGPRIDSPKVLWDPVVTYLK